MRAMLYLTFLSFLLISCQGKRVVATDVHDQSFYKINIIRVALGQAENPSLDWEPQQRDCAGFVRYIYRQVLHNQQPLWQPWNGNDKVHFANAELLVSKNFTKLSDEVSDSVRTGDILVFRRDNQKKENQWHLMLLMESPWEQNKWLVIYHTGSPDQINGVKKLWLNELLTTELEQWKPIKGNKNFAGVYRWNAWAK